MTIKKQLPIGVSTFEEIINSNLLYIDKTEIVRQLMTTNRRCFFSRPRRFGKSLLISTLKEIFLGNKELFKDLWIGQEGRYEWITRPVVHIDFSKLNAETLETLKNDLNNTLDALATSYGVDISHRPFPREKIACLAEAIGVQTKVAILIDEYDAPLLKHITNTVVATEMRDFLSGFYTTIKALDANIHFTFITGVTKFSKTSLFSGSNNLNDISLNEKYSTLCGYTEKEILINFKEYIDECATAKHTSSDAIMDEMRTWYNGYQMSDYLIEKVYNPYSVLLYLENKKLKNYWFTSGTPTFLIKIIKENLYDFTGIDHSITGSNMLDSFDVNTLPLKTMLYQTGYLTIENFNEQGQTYTLTYPNEEVRQSLNQTLLESVLELKNDNAQVIANVLRQALYAQDMDAFCNTLQILFSHIPYQLHLKEEAFYHALLQMICYMIGMNVTSEISVASGIIDMVIRAADTTYVFEFKLNRSATAAMEQIHKRRYYEKYLADRKELFLVGLAFNYETKTITHVVEKIKISL